MRHVSAIDIHMASDADTDSLPRPAESTEQSTDSDIYSEFSMPAEPPSPTSSHSESPDDPSVLHQGPTQHQSTVPERPSVRKSLRFVSSARPIPSVSRGDSGILSPLEPLEGPPSNDSPYIPTDSSARPAGASPLVFKPKRKRTKSITSDRQQRRERLNQIIGDLADFVGKQPIELKHICHKNIGEASNRTRRRFVTMQMYLANLCARAINPTTPDELIDAANTGIIHPSMKDMAAKEFDHLVNLYMTATEKKVQTSFAPCYFFLVCYQHLRVDTKQFYVMLFFIHLLNVKLFCTGVFTNVFRNKNYYLLT